MICVTTYTIHNFVPVKKSITIVLLFLGIVFSGFGQKSEVILVIDPGHGGSDPGHLSADTSLLAEKDLNLKIAQYFGGYIEKYLQNVKVVYTRTDDSYPSLDARVSKANELNADYFISIHCNGNDRESVRGTETHIHSMDLKNSVSLARSIEKQFSSRAGRHSRGIKDQNDLQHSLQVLKYTNMTSVLVECGFMTNKHEAKFLNTTYGQEIIASAIFRAFREHITDQHPDIAFIKSKPSNQPSEETTQDNEGKYVIQILSSKQPIDTDGTKFSSVGMAVTRKEINSTNTYKYVYTVGTYVSVEQAKEDLVAVREKGYKDAFIRKL